MQASSGSLPGSAIATGSAASGARTARAALDGHDVRGAQAQRRPRGVDPLGEVGRRPRRADAPAQRGEQRCERSAPPRAGGRRCELHDGTGGARRRGQREEGGEAHQRPAFLTTARTASTPASSQTSAAQASALLGPVAVSVLSALGSASSREHGRAGGQRRDDPGGHPRLRGRGARVGLGAGALVDRP